MLPTIEFHTTLYLDITFLLTVTRVIFVVMYTIYAGNSELTYCKKIGAGVTGQNIPPAGVYPGILWPRPIYTPGHILA